MAVVAFVASCAVICLFLSWAYHPKTNLPAYKSPGVLAFLNDAEAYAVRPVELIHAAAAACGDAFSVQVLTIYNVWLSGNQLNRFYLDQKEDTWSFAGGMGYFLNKIVETGYWAHYKVFLSSLNKYVNTKAAREYGATVAREEALQAAKQWAGSKDVEVFDGVSSMVHRIIVRSFMGDDFLIHHADELLDLVHAMENDIGSIWSLITPDWVPHPPARRIWRARDRVKAIFLERLEERRKSMIKSSTSLQDYIAFTMADPATIPLASFLPSQHTVLMFAAHTSTAAMISWNLVCLLRHPIVLEELSKELRASSGDGSDSVLLQACLKETLRCYSGFKTLRLARKRVRIPDTDWTVPPGALVSISPYLTHYDSDNFTDPTRWAPQRWINNENQIIHIDNKTHGAKYIPFSGGAHRCPGEHFAMIMISRSLCAILRNYDLDWASPELPQTTDFTKLDFDKIGAPWLKGGVCIRLTEYEED